MAKRPYCPTSGSEAAIAAARLNGRTKAQVLTILRAHSNRLALGARAWRLPNHARITVVGSGKRINIRDELHVVE